MQGTSQSIRGAGSSSIQALYDLIATLTKAQIQDADVQQLEASIKGSAAKGNLVEGFNAAQFDYLGTRARATGGLFKAGFAALGGCAGIAANKRSTGQLGERASTCDKVESGFKELFEGGPNSINEEDGLVASTGEEEIEGVASDPKSLDSKLRCRDHSNAKVMLGEDGELNPEIKMEFERMMKAPGGKELAKDFMKDLSREALVRQEEVNNRRSSDLQWGQSISGFTNGSGELFGSGFDLSSAGSTQRSGMARANSELTRSLQSTAEQGEQKSSGKVNSESQQIEKVVQTIESVIQADTARA